ncbi:MAG: S8 family serine peptidase [Lachnospiraceae bacterium]|nr:S8 family serine peptidase [Lachnospiraceae bacterium]
MNILLPSFLLVSAFLSVNDASAGDQWALRNDGGFYFEEMKERHYLNGDQELIAQGPGAWTEQSLYEVRDVLEKKEAVSGIDINIEEAWKQYGNGSREVVVAMIDTEIDFSHEDLQGRVWFNEDEIPGNGIDDDQNGYVDDVNGWNFSGDNNQSAVSVGNIHGTHGAGTICAVSNNGVGISGIVPGDKIKIMPIKVMEDNGGNSSTTLLIRAIKYAQENGADICNLSFVSMYNDSTLYNTMKQSPMLFVVAAGNGEAGHDFGNNIDEKPVYPAAFDLENMITVANLTCDGSLNGTSNYGKINVDLAAPGTNILSTVPGNAYKQMSGTSMAAPMVTGTAAMLYSRYADINIYEIKDILLRTVTPLEKLNGKVASGGMLNSGAALAFDRSKASGKKRSVSGSNKNSAPVVESFLQEREGEKILMIRVVDPDNDIKHMLITRGLKDLSYFTSGSEGISRFSVNEHGLISYRIQVHGVYTVLITDEAGHVTLEHISTYPENLGPGAVAK